MTLTTRLRNLAMPASVSVRANQDTRARRRALIVSWAARILLLPASPAAAAVGMILVFPQLPSVHISQLLAVVVLSVASCATAWIVRAPGAWPVFRLTVHASLAVVSGWIAWQYGSRCLAHLPADPLQAASEFPERFRHLVQSLRELHGLLPALAPIVAPAIWITAAIQVAGLIGDVLKGRKAAEAQPRNRAGRAGPRIGLAEPPTSGRHTRRVGRHLKRSRRV